MGRIRNIQLPDNTSYDIYGKNVQNIDWDDYEELSDEEKESSDIAYFINDVPKDESNWVNKENTGEGDLVFFKTNIESPLTIECEVYPTQEGSGTPSYTNERPIKIPNPITIKKVGKNLFNNENLQNLSWRVYSSSTTRRYVCDFIVPKSGIYTISCQNGPGDPDVVSKNIKCNTYSNNTYGSPVSISSFNTGFSLTRELTQGDKILFYFDRLTKNTAENYKKAYDSLIHSKIQIEYNNEATEYELYCCETELLDIKAYMSSSDQNWAGGYIKIAPNEIKYTKAYILSDLSTRSWGTLYEGETNKTIKCNLPSSYKVLNPGIQAEKYAYNGFVSNASGEDLSNPDNFTVGIWTYKPPEAEQGTTSNYIFMVLPNTDSPSGNLLFIQNSPTVQTIENTSIVIKSNLDANSISIDNEHISNIEYMYIDDNQICMNNTIISDKNKVLTAFNSEKTNGNLVETNVPKNAVFTDTTYYAIPQTITNISQNESVSVDDITSWSSGSMTIASITNGILEISNGSTPSLEYTSKSVSNLTTNSIQVVKNINILNSNDYYGMIIHQDTSDPQNRIEYIGKNVDYTPMSVNFSTGEINYGDWKDMPTLVNNKPAMIRRGGVFDYWLDENNYSLKSNGGTSDIGDLSYSGDAFSWFDAMYMKIIPNNLDLEVRFAYKPLDDDYFEICPHGSSGVWLPMFYGYMDNNGYMRSIGNTPQSNVDTSDNKYSAIKKNGDNYYFYGGKLYECITLLEMLWFKTTNSDNIGLGNQLGFGAIKSNPILNGGQFYLTNTGTDANKILHSVVFGTYDTELFNPYILNKKLEIFVSKDYSYDLSGVSYSASDIALGTINSGTIKTFGYIDKYGLIPIDSVSTVSATQDTYYCDCMDVKSDNVFSPTILSGDRLGYVYTRGLYTTSQSKPYINGLKAFNINCEKDLGGTSGCAMFLAQSK